MKELPYSPHDLLPIKTPIDNEHDGDYFYNNVVKYLIADCVRIMNNGIPIDLNKIKDLEDVVTDILTNADNIIANNPIMIDFLKEESKITNKNTIEKLTEKYKDYTEFIKPFNLDNTTHKNYLVNTVIQSKGITEEYSKIDNSNWTIKEIKAVNEQIKSTVLSKLLDKDYDFFSTLELAVTAMENLAKDKASIYNKKYDTKIENVSNEDITVTFNPKSTVQISKFFEYLGIQSEELTKTGNYSFNRDQLERINRDLANLIKDSK